MELKFRAWHKEHEKYYEVATFNFYEEVVGLVLSQSIPQKESTSEVIRTKEKIYVEVDYVFFDKVIIEQYTDLKDKNGKEIYVGDIVTFKVHTRSTSEEIEYGIVDYHQGMVYISNSSGYSDEYITNVYELEVIGNIHENKELLKGE